MYYFAVSFSKVLSKILFIKLISKPHQHNKGCINTILFSDAKIVIKRDTTKFRASSKIGITLKIPTTKYDILSAT